MSDNLYDLLSSRFPTDRSKPCFLFGDGAAISYAELEQGVARIAGLLIAKGVAPGDRVAAQVEKTPEAVMLYLATLKAGGVFTPLNTAYTAAEIGYFLNDAEPKLFVQDAVALAREAAGAVPLRHAIERDAADLASIIYTSGTTGRSKGAMLSHGNLADNALALHRLWGFSETDVLLHALPIFHVHGLFVALHCAFLSGCSMVWLPRFNDAEVIDGLARSTVMMGVPTFYTRLLANPDFTRQRTEHMRLFVCGSAPLLASTFAEFEQRTGQRILERYGMSEAVIITSNPLVGDRLAGSVGFPLPGVDLRIDGGETGVLQIKGPSVFGGYWRMPDKTREEFTADGYFITGDVGRKDTDGRVWISGRAKDLIISGGFNVYPKEVEMVLDELAGVTESAVIGLPHPDFGEGVVAVVIGSGDETVMIAAAREQLAVFKAPKRIFFVDDLPRNAMGKVQKNLLRETYAGLFGPDSRAKLIPVKGSKASRKTMAKRDLTGAVDFAYLEGYAGGDQQVVDEVLALFREQAAMWLRLLEPAAADGVWRDAVHTLKGSARGIGAGDLADACAAAEAAPDGQLTASLERVRFCLDLVLADIAAYAHEQALKSLKSSAS